jgi:hypothetical protein
VVTVDSPVDRGPFIYPAHVIRWGGVAVYVKGGDRDISFQPSWLSGIPWCGGALVGAARRSV